MLRFLIISSLSLVASSALAQVPLSTVPLATEAPVPGLRQNRVSYHLNMGASFAGRYGSASYISPLVSYQVSNRFSAFGGVTYLRAMPGAALRPTDAPAATGLAATNHYLLYGGGTYLLSPRLALTSSAWKDLTPPVGGVNPYAGFTNTMGQGVNMRADYRLTENVTVSGGIRVSQGAAYGPGYSPLYSPLGY